MRTESQHFTFFLASIAALTSLSIDMSLPAVPAIESNFHLAAGQGGLTLSLFLAGYAVSPLFGGPLADRFGRRPILILSLMLFTLSALACAFSPGFGVLLFFRLLQGCASGISTTMPLAIVRDLLESHAARQRISEVTTINSIMPIVAPIFGSWLTGLGSWRIIFATQALFAVGIITTVLSDFTESLPQERRQRLYPGSVVRNYGLLLTNRVFLGYSLIYGLIFACMFSFISTSPLLLMQRMNVRGSIYTLLFALIATGTILGSFTSAMLSRNRISVHFIISAGLMLMSGASLSAAVLQLTGVHRLVSILPPVFVTFFGFGLTGPPVTLEALGPVPWMAGSGSGALRSILMIFGSGVSGFLSAYCARHSAHAEAATTWTMSTTAVTALLLYLLLVRGLPHGVEATIEHPLQ
jgi:MFS transporter, DHA1 family, multidrug resistance protein